MSAIRVSMSPLPGDGPSADSWASATERLSMHKVLVVDDLAIFREPLKAVLEASGYAVTTASNGEEAFSRMLSERPDLILLDLEMPVMDGVMLLSRIREHRLLAQVKVIVLSCEDTRERIAQAAALGISGYLLKSAFSVGTLLDRVAKTLLPSEDLSSSPAATPARETSLPAPRLPPSPGAGGQRAFAHNHAARDEHADANTARSQRANAEAALKAMRPLLTRTALLERLREDSELTAFSPAVSQVLQTASSQTCTMDEVAKAVSQDQAIAIKVLKLANSSIYGPGERVDTVHKAVLRIGVESLRQAVLNIAIVERFSCGALEGHLSLPLFWEHSIACGLIAAQLAHVLGHTAPEAAFTTGLLHDLGRVLFAERLGTQYVQVLETAATADVPLERIETRLLGINHADVMSRFLDVWRFPKELALPIALHHADLEKLRASALRQLTEIARLALANRLAHALVLGSSGNDVIYPTAEHCTRLGVTADMIRQIESTARQQTDDTKIALVSRSHGQPWPRQIDQFRALLGCPCRPQFIGVTPDLDAFRLFCSTLADGTLADEPNVIVVHLACDKDHEALGAQLAATLEATATKHCPVLVLSPEGNIPPGMIPPTWRCAALSTPTPIRRLIATLRDLIPNERSLVAA